LAAVVPDPKNIKRFRTGKAFENIGEAFRALRLPSGGLDGHSCSLHMT
jgi:hypothetical protein